MHNSGTGLRGQLLGSLELFKTGEPLRRPGDKLRALIAYLAWCREPVSRRELVELLWINGKLIHLRQLLPKAREWLDTPGVLEVTDLDVQLHLETDAAAFTVLCENEEYQAALELWPVRGGRLHQQQLLADVQPPTEKFRDWLELERAHLAALREEALLALALQHERAGEDDKATAAYQDLLSLDGLAEEACRGMMRIALRSGQIEPGLSQYETLLQRLRREFSGPVEPLPETVRLAEQLRHAAAQTEAAEPVPLPDLDAVNATFTGRHAELEQLGSLLNDAVQRVVTVTAPAGTGKTAIAIQLARRWRTETGGRLVFIEVEHCPAELSLPAFAAAELDVRLPVDGDVFDLLAAELSRRPTLLVFDGVEAKPETGAVISKLAEISGASSRVLVTSRDSLNLYNEIAWALPPMDWPAADDTARALEFDSVRLFCHAARRSLPGFDPGTRSLGLIGRICAAVGGLPLAIVLAASLARIMSLEAILRNVEADPLALQSQELEVEQRHRRLHNVVVTTWVNMDPSEQNSLRQLSVFQGGFDAEAARDVARTGLHNILSFVNRSLISSRSRDRFDLHPLLRSWGVESLNSTGQLPEALRRHSRYYLDYANELYRLVGDARLADYLEAAAADAGNFRATLDLLAREERWDEGVQLCMHLVPYWDVRGKRSEAVQTAERFLPHAGRSIAKGRLLSGLCSINRRLGYLDEALAYSRQAEQLFAAEGATVAHAMELASQAMIARMISDLTRAGELYDKALAVVRAAGEQDQYALSVLLNNYGVFLQTAGRLDEALEIHRECLAIREKRGDVRGMIDSFGNLADILGDSGRAEEGLQLREQLLAMPELQEADDVTARLVRLGRTRDLTLLNRHSEAVPLLQELLADARAGNDRVVECYVLAHLGTCSLQLGHLDAAVDWYRQAAEKFTAQRNHKELPGIAEGLALIAGRLGNRPYVQRAVRAAAALRQELGLPARPPDAELISLLDQAPATRTEPEGRPVEEIAWVFATDPRDTTALLKTD